MADFQAHLDEFKQRNVAIMATSVDPLEDTQALIADLDLTFPVGYALDHMEFATKTGAFYEVRRSIIHATGFILLRDGHVAGAVYSTNPIGRYQAINCIRTIDFLNRQKSR